MYLGMENRVFKLSSCNLEGLASTRWSPPVSFDMGEKKITMFKLELTILEVDSDKIKLSPNLKRKLRGLLYCPHKDIYVWYGLPKFTNY